MNKFIYLGASPYALKILQSILAKNDSKLLCIVDSNMDEKKKEYILDRIPTGIGINDLHDATLLEDHKFLSYLSSKTPHLAMSVHFSRILKKDFIDIPLFGVINLHPSFLPYNRGHWPEIWSIVNNTPAGVSIHFVDEGIDTGKIIDQKEVEVFLEDTSESLCSRIEIAGLLLVESIWDSLISGRSKACSQTVRYPINNHRKLDLITEIDLNQSYKAGELINILRALTLPDLLPGAYFRDPATGDKIRINIALKREDR